MLSASPVATVEVVVTPGWSRKSVVNAALVETWTRYEVAPVAAAHDSVGLNATFVAAFAGELSTGAGGTADPAAVVKLRVAE